jgi:hypothetical protein
LRMKKRKRVSFLRKKWRSRCTCTCSLSSWTMRRQLRASTATRSSRCRFVSHNCSL